MCCLVSISLPVFLSTPIQRQYCAVQENIHTPPQRGLEFPGGGGGSLRPTNLKKCIKLNWNFQRGGGLRKSPFCGGDMDIFWNYTCSLVLAK